MILIVLGTRLLLALFPIPDQHSQLSDWFAVHRGAAFGRYAIAPAISVLVGSFVGWFARRPAWVPAVLAILPAGVVFAGGLADSMGILCGIVYAILGSTVALAVGRWRSL